MFNTEIAIMALPIEREMACSEMRMERLRQLAELDAQARGTGRPTRFDLLRGYRRLTAAALRGRWLHTARRHAVGVSKPVALGIARAGVYSAMPNLRHAERSEASRRQRGDVPRARFLLSSE